MRYDDINVLYNDVIFAIDEGVTLEDVATNFDDNGRTCLRISLLYERLDKMKVMIGCYQCLYDVESEMQTEHDKANVEDLRNSVYNAMIEDITRVYEDFISYEFADYRIREWQSRTRDMLQRVKETFS
ncbi:MAG: hypothetical protein MJ048_04660 [Acidaminococcaceae bacterium]|nr:hypothetical protein [Acidaminococcaceae bacterium]